MKEKKGEKACPLVAKQGKVKVLEMRSVLYFVITVSYFICVILYVRYFILPYLLYSTVSALQTSILGVCNDQI